MKRLHEQVSAVFDETGWSVAELLQRSGLPMDRSTLQRKLRGKRPMSTRELEVLVNTMRTVVSFGRERRAS